ncbi:hypothetical protein NL676_014547 [Syzygium grande]|nr:hypothetical protein NL676_014547 [Syzygium grande]
MAEKVTRMWIKVDLQCPRCYKKIKKILCKFPQIRDQIYDEKKNTVEITVVCCSPEKIRQKIICEGGKIVKKVETKHVRFKEPPKKKLRSHLRLQQCQYSPRNPCSTKASTAGARAAPPKAPKPMAGYPPVPMYPMRRPVMCYDGCGRPADECPGGNRGYYVSQCDYFSEENATACTVM